VLIRRDHRMIGAEILQVGDLRLDPATHRVSRAGHTLQLSPTAIRLLGILMRESPRVVSRQDIEREIWGRVQLRNATPAVVKGFRRFSLSNLTAKWSCPWPQAA